MTPDEYPAEAQSNPAKRAYEPPTVTEVFVDPAKDMLVVCVPGKFPDRGSVRCNAVQFT